MKTIKYKLSFSICIVFVFISTLTISAQTKEVNISSTVAVKSNTLMVLNHPNFDTEVKTWDRNEVKIEYNLKLEAKENETEGDFIKEFKNVLEEQLKATTEEVQVNVGFKVYNRFNNKIIVELKGGKGKYEFKSLDGSLVVYMPKQNSLQASISFRKLSIGDLTGDLNVGASSSDLVLGDCNNLKLHTSFCKDITAGKLNSANLILNSSGIETGNIAKDLIVDASFSEIEIGEIGGEGNFNLNSSSFKALNVGNIALKGSFVRTFKVGKAGRVSLNLNSATFEADETERLDIGKASFSTVKVGDIEDVTINNTNSCKLYISSVNSIDAQSCSFTSFEIGNLHKRFVVDANSGSVTIDNVPKGFDMIDITGQFFTVDFHVAEDCNLILNADFKFPNYGFSNINFERVDKNMSEETIKAWKGEKEKATSEIKLNCNSCKVRID